MACAGLQEGARWPVAVQEGEPGLTLQVAAFWCLATSVQALFTARFRYGKHIAVYDLAELDSATAGALSLALKPALTVGSLLMVARIVMTWYPEVDGRALPWSIAFYPTEAVLAATRRVVPPFNGLDVSPIVWVALLSLLSEVLTGPQGILTLIARKGI